MVRHVPFQNREQAASLLADRLAFYRGQRPLVLAIPRGAAPMAEIIAKALQGDLDVVLVHKLGAPGQPELAVGAVDEFGAISLGRHAHELGVDQAYLEREAQLQLATLRTRRSRYTPVHPPIDPAGRVVIIVDDGVATGATMIAALKAVRAKHPTKLVAATAVAPPETFEELRGLADDVVCLEVPEMFFAVGQFFRDFPQVSDEDVVAILKRSRSAFKT